MIGPSLRAARFAAVVACAIAFVSTSPGLVVAAEPAAHYRQVRPSADGIGKTHAGREIAHVMGWQAAPWLEREEREKEERGSVLLRELRLSPGMAVADIGAGSGYYTRRIAPLVLPSGSVFAVDIQPQMLELVRKQADESGLRNVRTVLGTSTDTELAPASIDLAIMVDVYHELEFPFEMMTSIVRALKPGGRVAFVEYRAEDDAVPIKDLHKMSQKQIRLEAEQHALVWERTSDALPWQHIVVFKKR